MTLLQLFEEVRSIHDTHYPTHDLCPIMGGGCIDKPRYMFVFINPTIRNVSTDSDWTGQRLPFIGTKHIWRIFNRAGHFPDNLLGEIESRSEWEPEFAGKVYSVLEEQGFYFTNVVKWAGSNADLPNSEMIRIFSPLLLKEIAIVKPANIVTFGAIPYRAITGRNIVLGEYYDRVIGQGSLEREVFEVDNHQTNLVPCYFPIGRGNPRRAVEVLRLLG